MKDIRSVGPNEPGPVFRAEIGVHGDLRLLPDQPVDSQPTLFLVLAHLRFECFVKQIGLFRNDGRALNRIE